MISLRNRRTAWIIALFAVVAAALISRATARRYVENEAAIRHTMALQAAIANTLSLLKDAETGQRGFILTGDNSFLQPHALAERELPAQMACLLELTSDDAEQLRLARQIQKLTQNKLSFAAETIRLSRTGHSDSALAVVRGNGKRTMDTLRAVADQMAARERTRLRERESIAATGEKRAWVAFVLAFALAVVLALGGLWTVRRDAIDARRVRQQLVDSERAFRALADNAADLVRILELDRTLSYVSPSSLPLLGYLPEELQAMSAAELLHEEELETTRAIAEQVRAKGLPALHVHRLRRRDGEYRWFETLVQPATDSASKRGRLHLTSRDVTEREVAEDALRQQTARLESILDSMGDGVVVLDQARRILVVNPAAKAYIRQEVGEVVSAHDWSKQHHIFLPDGVTPFPSEQGPLTRALRGEANAQVEIVIHDRADNARVMNVNARPIEDSGKPAGCVAVYHDITEQRRAARQLLESERRWRVLSEASFEGVAITKLGVVVDMNDTLSTWLGYSREELVGNPGLPLFVPEERERVIRESLPSDNLYEAHMLRRDGTQFPVEVRGRSVEINGEQVRIVVVRDVTEKKRREAELTEQAEVLRTLSVQDELTGLYNRRGFLELTRQRLRQILLGKKGACLFFADLNGMKAINDGLGHEVGDRALITTANLLSNVFRESDVVARLGGDEFAALAGECEAAGLTALQARLQTAIETFNAAGLEPFRLSVSIGAALFDPRQPLELEALMEAADVNMYEAKRARARADGLAEDSIRSGPRKLTAAGGRG